MIGGSRGTVLVSHPDEGLRATFREALEDADFEVVESADPATTSGLAIALRPDAIVVDATDQAAVTETVGLLRKDFRSAFRPLVYLCDAPPGPGLVAGADDYVLRPFEPTELVARVKVTLRRSAALRGLNPLTGLPGNTLIDEEIARRLGESERFACLYMDLDHFKAYNDRYGFTRGDEMIMTLARCIEAALEQHRCGECFAGHVGGDDFVVLAPTGAAEDVAKSIVERFDTDVRSMYEPAVRRRGWMEVSDRQGATSREPLCSVSIGIVSSEGGFTSAAQMSEVAAEVKGVAKRRPGSSFTVERRER